MTLIVSLGFLCLCNADVVAFLVLVASVWDANVIVAIVIAAVATATISASTLVVIAVPLLP